MRRPPEASPPAQGFIGEHLYYEHAPLQFVDATCVDVSTDWVPLFDMEVIVQGEVVESHRVRGFTELHELAASRGWVRWTPSFPSRAAFRFGRPAPAAKEKP